MSHISHKEKKQQISVNIANNDNFQEKYENSGSIIICMYIKLNDSNVSVSPVHPSLILMKGEQARIKAHRFS